jgi:succinyl-diaminopimelate desuccinylase
MYKEKISAYIDSKKEEMLADLAQLVRIDSQKGEAQPGKPFGEGPAQVLAAAEELMKKYGLLTRNYDNYVITGDFSDKEKELDILAHLDVVPVTDEWTVTQPFEPKIVDGRIYGRGTADDKGPAIAALYAMRAIKELGIPMDKSVRLILGSDEECGSSDLRYYYSREEEAPCSFTPDADFPVINIEKGHFQGNFSAEFSESEKLPAVLGVKSGNKVNVVPHKARFVAAGLTKEEIEAQTAALCEEMGVTLTCTEIAGETDGWEEATAAKIRTLLGQGTPVVEAEVRGKAAHASTPQEGKNALTAAMRLLACLPFAKCDGLAALKAIDTLFPYEDTCGKTLGIYREEKESGAVTLCLSIFSYSETKLNGTFDSRLPVGCDEANTKAPATATLAKYGITLEDTPVGLPHCVPGDSDFVKTLLGSYERFTGVKGKPLSTGGGTYVHNLKRGVAFGCMVPEVDNHMHGDDEFMVIDHLLLSAKIFADAIVKICNA